MRHTELCHICGKPIENRELAVRCNTHLWAHDHCIKDAYGLRNTGATYDIKAIKKKITRRK